MWEQMVLEGVSDDVGHPFGKNRYDLVKWLENIVDDMASSNWDDIVSEMSFSEKNKQRFDPLFWHPDLFLIQVMFNLKGPRCWINFLRKEINPPRFFCLSFLNPIGSKQQLKEKFIIEQELKKLGAC
jgi:hypothetical protein